jgi:opacity protein-like surface antigen
MRKLLGLASLVVVSLPLVAAAQPPPPPPPPPSGGGGGYGGEPEEPKMRLDVALIAGLPQQDLSDTDAGTSPGLGIAFGYTVANNISISAGLRYFAVQSDSASDAGVDLASYDFILAGRYSFPISPTAKAFGEALLMYDTFSVSGGGESDSASGVGFGARGGAQFNVSGKIALGGAVSFTTANVSDQGADADIGWLGIEGFVSFGF